MRVFTPTGWNFFMGVRTKAILWLLPLPPPQNWLYRNALIATEQKDALCPTLPHGCALILYGIGIKTASVSSHGGRTRWPPRTPWEVFVRLWYAKMAGFIYLAVGGEKHLPLVIRVPFVCLGMCDCEWLSGSHSGVEKYLAPFKHMQCTSLVLI